MESAGLRRYLRFGAFAELADDRAGLVCIALKEARECHYWLRLLIAAKVMPEKRLA